MAINFPDTPSINDTFSVEGKTWLWDGTSWVDDSDALAVLIAGSTMTGPLVLSGSPSLPNGAANKDYVDSQINSQTASIASKAPLTPDVNAKTISHTLTASDRGEFITCTNTMTITIPSGTFSAGDRIDFVNIGTGVITFTGSGVTVNSVDGALTIDTQWAGATFFFTSPTAGVLIGKLA